MAVGRTGADHIRTQGIQRGSGGGQREKPRLRKCTGRWRLRDCRGIAHDRALSLPERDLRQRVILQTSPPSRGVYPALTSRHPRERAGVRLLLMAYSLGFSL